MKRGSYNAKWADAEIARLRLLVEQGCSAGVIAGYMGKTRNQICGKCWRLGLTLKARITNNKGSKPKAKRTGPLTVDEICRIVEAA